MPKEESSKYLNDDHAVTREPFGREGHLEVLGLSFPNSSSFGFLGTCRVLTGMRWVSGEAQMSQFVLLTRVLVRKSPAQGDTQCSTGRDPPCPSRAVDFTVHLQTSPFPFPSVLEGTCACSRRQQDSRGTSEIFLDHRVIIISARKGFLSL